MVAGGLEIQMWASITRLAKDLHEAQNVVKGSMNRIEGAVSTAKRALGALGIGIGAVAFARMVSGALDTQDALQKMSQKVNETVENLVGLKHAFELGGVQMEQVQKGLGTLASQMFDASMGLLESKRNFAALGIEITNADGTMKSATAVMLEMSDQMAKTGISTTNMALAKKLLGKAGLEMIPTLRVGSEEMRRMMEEGQRLYPVTAENARQAEILNDNLMILGKEIKSGAISTMNKLVPGINEVTEAMKVAAKEAGLLTAAWVGLGGVMAFVLGQTGAQKETKHIEDIANKLAEVRKQLAQGFIIPGYNFTPEARAKLQKQFELLQAESARLAAIGTAKEEAAKAEAAKKAKAAAELAAKLKAQEEAEKAGKEAAARAKKYREQEAKAAEQAQLKRHADAEEHAEAMIKIPRDIAAAKAKEEEEDRVRRVAHTNFVIAESIREAQQAEAVRKRADEERLREVKRVADETDRMLGDAIMRGFERGEDAAKNFRDTLVNMFKTLVLRPIISAVMSPVTGAITSGLGAMGFSGLTNAAGSAAGAGLVGSVGGWMGTAAAGAPVTSTIGAVASGAGYAGAGSTGMIGALAAIPGWGWAALGAAAIGAYLLSGENERQRDLIAMGIQGKVGKGGLQGNVVSTWGTGTDDAWGGTTSGAIPSAALTAINNTIGNIFANMTTAAEKMGLSVAGLDSVMVDFGATWTNGDQTQADLARAFNATSDAIAEKLIPNIRNLQFQGETLTQTFERLYAAQVALDAKKRTMEIELMEAQGKTVEALAAKREDELAALDPTLRALQKQIYAAQDLANAANDAGDAVSKLAELLSETQNAVNEQIGASRSAAQAARAAAESFRQIGKALADAVVKISGGGKAGAADRLQALFGTAMTGDAAALSALPQAGQDFLAASLKTSRSSLEFARDQAKVVAMLNKAQIVSTAMVNWNEYHATLLELQTGVLETIRDQLALPSPDAAILTQQYGMLGTIAELLQDQTIQVIEGNTFVHDQTGKIITGNTMLGAQTSQIITGNATQDVIKNITALNTSYSEQQLAALVASGGLQSDSLTALVTGNAMTISLLQQLVAMQGAASMAAYDAKYQEAIGTIWNAIKSSGGTLADFDLQIAAWRAANPMPSYAVGSSFVPNTGPALLHRGERVMNAAANDELVTEIRSLRAEVASMRKDTRKSADTLEAVANGQLAFSTEAA